MKPPFFIRWLSPDHLLCEVPACEKVIFLTFDDGPSPETTPGILKILEDYHARATFFMVGGQVRKYPELVKTLKSQGHGTGNHTFHHLNGWHTPTGAYLEDVERCHEVLDSRLFRPPYGKLSLPQFLLLRKHYRIVLWSVLTYDFSRRISAEKCLEIAVRNSRPGSVVVFHDNIKATDKISYVLPRFLDHFSRMGFRFESLPV